MLDHTFKRYLVSVAVAAGLTGSFGIATAGEIVSDSPQGEALQSTVSSTGKQFGFGGWNMENVNVSLLNTIDQMPTGGSFDKENGTYSQMRLLESFSSALTTDDDLRAYLFGKSWPVGEPAGVKVINGDLLTNNGRPENCIMTTSYLESGYLDDGNKPTVCSSGFQTHKRFKVHMLPSMVANTDSGEGLPVEMTFNLKPDDSSEKRYQVFQKLNNYTGKRLDGYKIEVVDENGLFNAALTLSMGIGENPGEDGTPGDIWDNESIANFSHGLWGPVDHHFDAPGFFDDRRVYLAPQLSADNQAIAYQGPILGGNYQSLFGNWLPAGWEPAGIIHDDDMDPGTDGELMAFWGDPLNTGSNAWHKGNSLNWETVSEEDLLRWTGEWYEQSTIEDVLNLGVNYIVNIGDNSLIGKEFTIRFIPYVADDQTPPAFISNPPPAPQYAESEGIVVMDVQLIADATETGATETQDRSISDSYSANFSVESSEVSATVQHTAIISIGVADGDLNTDPSKAQDVEVTVMSNHGESEIVLLRESGLDTGRFVGTLAATVSNDASLDNDGKFNLNRRTNLNARYVDNQYGDQDSPQTLEATLDLDVGAVPAIPVNDAVDDDDSSSFSAQDRTSLVLMILGFLGMGGAVARAKLEPVKAPVKG